jgi:cytochrome P450
VLALQRVYPEFDFRHVVPRNWSNSALCHLCRICSVLPVSSELTSQVLLLAVYRVALHPLKKFPGPLFFKITDWPNVYHSFKGDRYLLLADLHKRYGPIVRFGPNRISCCSASALQSIYGVRANTGKADWYRIWEMLFGAASTATILDRKVHAKRKRVLQLGFSERALSDVEHILLRNTDEFCDILLDDSTKNSVDQKGWGPARNLSLLVGYLTFDNMGEMVFSKSFGMQHRDTNRAFLGLSMDALRGLNTVAFIPLLLTMKLHILFFNGVHQGMMKYKHYCANQSDERIARSGTLQKPDIWTRVINGKDDITGHSFTPEDLRSEAAILVSVASHPMRITVSALTHYLLDRPDCMQKLVSELRGTFEDVGEIGVGDKLKSCSYLRACITETLRLSPSIPGIPLRTARKGGAVVDGEFFPEGTDLGVPTYALQHAEEYFADPFQFVPERWIPAVSQGTTSKYQTAEAQRKANEAFCAFSLGPDGCIGQTMVYQHVSVIVARMLWTFELKRTDGSDAEQDRIGKARDWAMHGEYPMNDKFAAEGDGPWIQVRKRV